MGGERWMKVGGQWKVKNQQYKVVNGARRERRMGGGK